MRHAIIKKVEFLPKMPKLLNVAAYARVSSGKDAMLHSLSAQVSYYSEKIQKHTGWKYCVRMQMEQEIWHERLTENSFRNSENAAWQDGLDSCEIHQQICTEPLSHI